MNLSMLQSNLEQRLSASNEEPARPSRSERRSSFIEEKIHGDAPREVPKKAKSSVVTIPKLSRSKKRSDGPERMLPTDFEPSAYTVIMGRGKRIAQTIGNQRLRIVSKTFLAEYATSMSCKSAKTRIVNKIVDIMKSACADNHCEAAFVRYCNGRCYEVDDSVAREKVGYQLRDLLGDKYESSSKSKVAKKHAKKLRNERNGQSEDPSVISPCTTMTTLSTPMDESLMAPIPVQYPTSTSRRQSSTSGHKIRLSFDAVQLLTEPLMMGRGSFILEGQISMI